MYERMIDSFAARGCHCFTFAEMCNKCDAPPEAIRLALRRLINKGVIALPYKQFYIILPPEYRVRGCLPPQEFIPDLMKHIGQDYYVGLLSAAEYHGAAHHRPQVFQVIVSTPRRPLVCGKMKVVFVTRKDISRVPVETKQTRTGFVRLSTSEATTFDLAGHISQSAGLDNVATVLAELAEKIDAERLAEASRHVPVTWAQRLGYLLELVGQSKKAECLLDAVVARRPVPVALLPGASVVGAAKDCRWSILVNSEVEADV